MSLTALLLAVLPLLATITPASAQATCNSTSLCGVDAPCCSEFGFCGSDVTFCHGGCNPLFSNSLTSCAPEPICTDASYTFTTIDDIIPVADYDGNATANPFTLDKGNITLTPADELALLLTQDNGGTRISSTHYIHYGTASAMLKTGKWAGVVTAFILMSDAKDEVDWEWPGATTFDAQSNYFWLGVIPPQTAGETHNVSTDTFSNYHVYTFDWQPDALTWSIDGNVVRTLQKADTMGPDGVYHYPTTPARVQLSLWPAGINASAPGTVQWSGGYINWNDPDYIAAGHFYALVKEVNITCSTNTAAGAVPAGSVSYIYGQNVSGIPSILASNMSSISGAVTLRTAVAGATAVIRALALAGALALGALVI